MFINYGFIIISFFWLASEWENKKKKHKINFLVFIQKILIYIFLLRVMDQITLKNTKIEKLYVQMKTVYNAVALTGNMRNCEKIKYLTNAWNIKIIRIKI